MCRYPIRSVCKCITGILLFVVVNVSAQSGAVFYVDSARVRALAEEAAYAEFPDIPPGGLVVDRADRHLNILCRSALDTGIVSIEEEDFEICTASVRFLVKDSVIESRNQSLGGSCVLKVEAERISVIVYEDGSTRVGGISGGSSNQSVDCYEEYEGWK